MPAKAPSPEQVREIPLSELHSFKKHPYISAFMHFGLSLHTKECTENTAVFIYETLWTQDNQQPDFFRQFHLFQPAGRIYVRSADDRLIFPVTAYDAVHDAVHTDIHQLVQCRILFYAIPLWCRILSLNRRIGKREKKKAGNRL